MIELIDRKNVCRACEGTGLLSDDEEWQYKCTVCGGDGIKEPGEKTIASNLLNVDENNRILD